MPDPKSDLTGKTALVTGASRGIGRAVAERLAGDGAQVAVHYGSDESAATATVTAIERAGGRAFAIRAKLGVDGDVDTLFEQLGAGLAGRPLDILVNNAGSGPDGTIEQTTPEQFDRIFAVNVKAPFFIIQRALPLLRDGGRVITISSTSTRVATPTQTSYVMTKAAVEVIGRTLANVLGARQITVNTVSPGATHTDMNRRLFEIPGVEAYMSGLTALDRVGRPADIAAAVAFLASDDARWITGHVLDVSGGMYLGPRL